MGDLTNLHFEVLGEPVLSRWFLRTYQKSFLEHLSWLKPFSKPNPT